jgi:hypothetical protein
MRSEKGTLEIFFFFFLALAAHDDGYDQEHC